MKAKLEDKINKLKKSARQRELEILQEEASRQLNREIEDDKIWKKQTELMSKLDLSEQFKEMKELKARLKHTLKLVQGQASTGGDEHEFVKNPYTETPDEEDLERLSKQLEEFDKETIRADNEDEVQRLQKVLEEFKEARKKS